MQSRPGDLEQETKLQEMSWLSDKTGRPKEQGGHRRKNVSLDQPTWEILEDAGNKSRFIEYSIKTSLNQPFWKDFLERAEAVNDSGIFKTAVTFVWNPDCEKANSVLKMRCFFRYSCGDGGFRVRLVVNELVGPCTVWLYGDRDYSWSPTFGVHDFGFDEFPSNQISYALAFQFRPEDFGIAACVSDIWLQLNVTDGLCLT